MTMSDSWISLNPLIEEPSSLPTPRLNSSAPRDVDGIVMCCSAPSTSTNWRSIHRIPSVSIRFSTDATVIFFDFAGVLAEMAIAFPPGRSHRSVRYLGRNLNIYKLFRQEIVRMAEILIENETMFGEAHGSVVHSTHTTDASISTVSSRVRKLEDLGVITGYVPVLNEARLGYDVLAVVGVKIHKGKLLEVQRRIAKDDRVTHVYDVTGEWDSIVVVRLKNTRELDAFIKRLGSMDYVENTYTQVVLNVVKEERRVLV